MKHRGRFAPSPSGRLHLGNTFSALLGWLWARAEGGEFLLRIEDLDPDRSKPEFIDGIFEDLEWLGLDWDGDVWRQSMRSEIYNDALHRLEQMGRAYPCWCSRTEVARAAVAPHAGEEGPVYPGTCAYGAHPKPGRAAAWRFRVAPGIERFDDAIAGAVEDDVARSVGDFVIRRMDGVASYQLAVVVDDALAQVTHVLRGADLLSSTGRQRQLQHALGYPLLQYAHVPLVLQADGKRLAKREGTWTVDGLRHAGWSPQRTLGLLAGWAGLTSGEPISLSELAPQFDLARLPRNPVMAKVPDEKGLA